MLVQKTTCNGYDGGINIIDTCVSESWLSCPSRSRTKRARK